ncbi:MAG TPA: hypothetical protein VN203_06765, partial [Candidatus Acidoferrum sp.]|nr:hypothetical protein [Candidatus Acidoferrum sp.]
MPDAFVIKKNEYHDSVFLMRVAKRISDRPGVLQAAALMGTEKNKTLLADIGISGAEISAATPNDLIVAVKADTRETLEEALVYVDESLKSSPPPS